MTLVGTGAGIAHTADAPAGVLFAHESSGMSLDSDGTHAHQQLEIPPGQPVPTVQLIVHPDAIRGWNLEVKVTNFRFAPERVNAASIPTEGHVHLYIDGKKITRIYGSWFYLPSLEPGQHQIKVTLNANGHETLVHHHQPIETTVIIQVPTTRQ
ncbi:hypothetical protein [Neosynechococcus sphagnicola]|uniref:hypothetical protein n=1 Tax=Neosynechococcus sphagnicola TaxID=1501145 RepID=UPI00068BA008|nr:hypothetical protein [Neosynechococcus sphagnicola]